MRMGWDMSTALHPMENLSECVWKYLLTPCPVFHLVPELGRAAAATITATTTPQQR
jgi:hypothetical protein